MLLGRHGSVGALGRSSNAPQSLSEEIASAQEAVAALVAVRGATPGRSPRATPRSSRLALQKPDAAWLALEERVAGQVAGLKRKELDGVDSERVLRASFTQLESRVHGLEGQGMRADRHAAELAGLVQALTEEQRALIIRLDRVEEQARSTRREPHLQAEEWQKRLSRLEREHRSVAMNLRLVITASEEVHQRQNNRLQSMEEQVDSHARTQRWLQPSRDSTARDPVHRELPTNETSGCGASSQRQTADSEAALAPAVRPELQGRLLRLEASLAEAAQSRDAQLTGVRSEVRAIHSEVAAVRDEVQASQETIRAQVTGFHEELQSRLDTAAASLAAASTAAGAAADGAAAREHAASISALQEQVDRLLALEDIHDFSAVSELQHKVDKILESNATGKLQSRVDELLALSDGQRRSDAAAVSELRERVDRLLLESDRRRASSDLYDLQQEVKRLATELDSQRSNHEISSRTQSDIAALWKRTEELAAENNSQRDRFHHATGKLEEKVGELLKEKERWDADARAASKLCQKVDELSGQHLASNHEGDLARLRSSMEEQAASVAALVESMHSSNASHTQDVAELKERFQTFAAVPSERPPDGSEHGDADRWAHEMLLRDVGGEIQELQSKYASLQETLDERLSMPLWRVDKQLPEVLERVEWLSGENADRHARLEEHDVRLGLALSRLTAQEQKIQSCIDKVEGLPGLVQIRGMWQDELRRRFEEADVQGIGQSVASQAQAIEELTE